MLKVGEKHWNWQGGRRKNGKYIMIYSPNHPFVDSQKTVYEHRLKMEEKLGRYLHPKEHVHHKDGNPSNNNIDNLELCGSNSQHQKTHSKPVGQFTKKGKLLKIWISGREAARQLKIDHSTIYDCCKGIRKTHHGFIWQNIK